MRSAGFAIALSVLLAGAAIQAQDDAGVGDAEGEIADASDAGVDEGQEYSAAEDARYEQMVIGGGALEVVGGGALIASLIVAAHAVFDGGFLPCSGSKSEAQANVCKEKIEENRRQDRIAAWVLVPVGFVAIIGGIPLIVKGTKGRERQMLLKRKDEILGKPHLTGLHLTMFSSRESTAGGLMMSGSF